MKRLNKKQQKEFENNFKKTTDFFIGMKDRYSCRSINNGYGSEPIPSKRGNFNIMLRQGFRILNMCGDR